MAEQDAQLDSKTLISFLVDDYKLKTDDLTAHFSRMWTRFNFILSVETGLFGVAFLADKERWSEHAIGFAAFGALVSAFWYVFGAQDRYLVKLYRDEIKFAAQRLTGKFKRMLGSENYQQMFYNYRYAGDTTDEAEGITSGPFQWRWKFISITRLAAIFPLVVLVLWAGIAVCLLIRH